MLYLFPSPYIVFLGEGRRKEKREREKGMVKKGEKEELRGGKRGLAGRERKT